LNASLAIVQLLAAHQNFGIILFFTSNHFAVRNYIGADLTAALVNMTFSKKTESLIFKCIS